MIRKVLLLLLSMCSVWGMAKQISVESAEKIAAKYVNNASLSKGVSKAPVLKSAGKSAGKSVANAEYYVFNVGDNEGFVIVSGDDEMTELVGYADSGNVDMNNMPDNMRAWLADYAGYVRYVQQSGSEPYKQSLAAATPVVDSFMKVYWNQMQPYNDLCPVYGSSDEKCPTGCVATAMAMVMKYYEWPDVGVGSNSYSSRYGTLSSDFSTHRYDWANMRNEYTRYYDESWNPVNEWTETEAAAVAQLMYDCGVAVDMNYASDASGALTSNMLKALRNNFKYTAENIERSGKTTAEFRQIIKEEMNNARPVLFSGQGSGGGHEFVVDGYDSNDFLHINWGWGGMSNGFFNMNYMNPDALGTGGGSGGYAYDQAIVILSPNKTGEEFKRGQLVLAYNSGNGGISTSQTQVAKTSSLNVRLNYVYNPNPEDWSGDLSVAVLDENGNRCGVASTRSANLPSGNYFTSAIAFGLNFGRDYSNLADGKYYICGVSKENRDGEDYDWVEITSTSRIEIEIKGDYVNVIPESGSIVGNKNVVCPEHSRLGSSSEFVISLHNNYGSVVEGDLYWTILRKSDNSRVYSGSQSAIIYDHSDFEDVVNVYFSASNYNLNEEYIFRVDRIGDITVENCQGEFVIDGIRPQQTLLFLNEGGLEGLDIPLEKFEKAVPQTVYAAYISNLGDEVWNGVFATGLYDGNDNLLSVTKNPYAMNDLNPYNMIGRWDFPELTPDMTGIVDGTYRIYMISKEIYNGEYYDEWKKITGDDGVEVSVRGDWVYVTENSGVETVDSDTFKAYPNPVTDYLTIECAGEIRKIEVFDISGASVARAKASARIDMSALPAGCYIVSVSVDSGASYRRVVLKR